MSVVHVAVTLQVRPGFEAPFDAKLLSFVRESMSAEGVIGVHVLRPAPDSGSREYGVLRSFENEAAAEQFYASELFMQWLIDVEHLVDGEPVHRTLTGLEAFFRSGSGAMPPRWKMALVTFLGVLPTALLWSNVIQLLGGSQHWLVRAATANVAVVITLTWGVMPLLTRLFRGWLQAGHRKSSDIAKRHRKQPSSAPTAFSQPLNKSE